MWYRFIECIHRTHCIHSVFIAYSIVNEAMLSCLPINNCSLYSSIMWHTLTHTHPHCPRPCLPLVNWQPPSLHIFRLFTVCKTIDDYWLSDCPQPPHKRFPLLRHLAVLAEIGGRPAHDSSRKQTTENSKSIKKQKTRREKYTKCTQKTSRRTREREKKQQQKNPKRLDWDAKNKRA